MDEKGLAGIRRMCCEFHQTRAQKRLYLYVRIGTTIRPKMLVTSRAETKTVFNPQFKLPRLPVFELSCTPLAVSGTDVHRNRYTVTGPKIGLIALRFEHSFL